jgi:hypothetical protein
MVGGQSARQSWTMSRSRLEDYFPHYDYYPRPIMALSESIFVLGSAAIIN